MAPKHTLSTESTPVKRTKKGSKSPAAQSATSTPQEEQKRIEFEVHHFKQNPMLKRHKTEDEKEIAEHAEFLEAPFISKLAKSPREMDIYFSITPNAEWSSMKPWNNIISEIFH